MSRKVWEILEPMSSEDRDIALVMNEEYWNGYDYPGRLVYAAATAGVSRGTILLAAFRCLQEIERYLPPRFSPYVEMIRAAGYKQADSIDDREAARSSLAAWISSDDLDIPEERAGTALDEALAATLSGEKGQYSYVYYVSLAVHWAEACLAAATGEREEKMVSDLVREVITFGTVQDALFHEGQR